MTKRTLRPTIAFSFGKEGAQLGQIPLIHGLHPSHALQLHRRGAIRGNTSLYITPQFDITLLLRCHPSTIRIALGHSRDGIFTPLLGQDSISHLNGEAVLQIVDADLAYVFGSGARSADFDLFETAAGAGLPGEDGEGDFAHSVTLRID
jgi:hypothetical protein